MKIKFEGRELRKKELMVRRAVDNPKKGNNLKLPLREIIGRRDRRPTGNSTAGGSACLRGQEKRYRNAKDTWFYWILRSSHSDRLITWALLFTRRIRCQASPQTSGPVLSTIHRLGDEVSPLVSVSPSPHKPSSKQRYERWEDNSEICPGGLSPSVHTGQALTQKGFPDADPEMLMDIPGGGRGRI
ncbi:hypothetical protein ElyMa_000596200 [Elysia marginata]|uniref:Uncharacterized protein n=1 Tax=Elysia marginata TaxID=1093978 RepID=A0AAV4G803_9GAST|nr:hypothetical protein ElyMa_000596200 [Elysia marginata]